MLNNKLYLNLLRLADVANELNKPQFMMVVSNKMSPKQIESINQTLIKIVDSLEAFKDYMDKTPFSV